jgi:hypothetical protein
MAATLAVLLAAPGRGMLKGLIGRKLHENGRARPSNTGQNTPPGDGAR